VAVRMLSTDGKSLRDAPASIAQPVHMLDELSGIHQQLDALLPASRPRQRLGGLAAVRAAEREKARARIEGTFTIDKMRAAGRNVRTIAKAHEAKLLEINANPDLTEQGKQRAREQVRQAFDKQLRENAATYVAAESELLTTFHGRSKTWLATRDKSAPMASTYAAATGLAALLPSWTPEDTMQRLEQAINERDVVFIDVARSVVKNLVSTDPRYGSLQSEAETLLEDAALALGDVDTDAHDVANELADDMRRELASAQHIAAKHEGWPDTYDNAGAWKVFDAPASTSNSAAA
jgi:hypothetical protein